MKEINALITRHTQPGATRDRALEAMSFLDLSGQPFGFRFKGLRFEQIKRVVAVYLKAEIISLVAPAVPGKLRAQYTVNPAFRKGAAESVTEVSKEDDLFYDDWDGELTEDELADTSIQWDEENEEEIRKAEEIFSKAQEIGATLAKGLKKGTKLYNAVTQLPLYLRLGDSTITEILFQSPFQGTSRETIKTALEMIAEAGHLRVEGSGRTPRKYSLVLEKQHPVAEKKTTEKKIVLASESQVNTALRIWNMRVGVLKVGPTREQLEKWVEPRINKFIKDMNAGEYDPTARERRAYEAGKTTSRSRNMSSEPRRRKNMTREERRASQMTR